MAMDPNDFLLSVGVKSAKFEKVGDAVVGTITRRPEVQQQRDIATGEPKFWNDGKPRLQLKVVLQTEEREDDEDNGERAVFIKGQMQTAVAQAVRTAGATGLEIGGKLQIKYVADGKVAQRGFNPPKVYEAKYRAPEVVPVPVGAGPDEEPIDDRAPSQVDPDEIPF